jgi:hypothetical protein
MPSHRCTLISYSTARKSKGCVVRKCALVCLPEESPYPAQTNLRQRHLYVQECNEPLLCPKCRLFGLALAGQWGVLCARSFKIRMDSDQSRMTSGVLLSFTDSLISATLIQMRLMSSQYRSQAASTLHHSWPCTSVIQFPKKCRGPAFP